MPNIKSSKKRVLVNEQKSSENKMIKTAVKTEIKKIDTLVKAGKKEEALLNLKTAYKMIDIAASKGILHKNNAANKKSKLAKRVNGTVEIVAAPVVEVAPVVAPVAPIVEKAKKEKKAKKDVK